MVHAYTLYYYNRIHNVWVYFYNILKRTKYRDQKISSFWGLSWVAGVEIVWKLFSLEMEQFCIMTFVMVQKPTPVIKFHRAMHKKVHIKLMYPAVLEHGKCSINVSHYRPFRPHFCLLHLWTLLSASSVQQSAGWYPGFCFLCRGLLCWSWSVLSQII